MTKKHKKNQNKSPITSTIKNSPTPPAPNTLTDSLRRAERAIIHANQTAQKTPNPSDTPTPISDTNPQNNPTTATDKPVVSTPLTQTTDTNAPISDNTTHHTDKALVIHYTKQRAYVHNKPTHQDTAVATDIITDNKSTNHSSALDIPQPNHATKTIPEPRPIHIAKPEKKLTKKLSAWQIGIIFISSMLLISWLKSEPLASYWQQSYQQNEPWSSLDRLTIWRQGAQITNTLDAKPVIDQVGQWGTQSTKQLNQAIYANEIAHREQLHQKQLAQQKEMARLAAENAQKAQEAAKPKKLTHASIHHNQKVFFAGDSMMQGVAPWVMRKLQNDHQIQSIDLSKQSTGLSYSSFFDWPATIENAIKNDPSIGLLIVFLGANDPWAVPDPKSKAAPYIEFATPEWNTLYHQKIERILTVASDHKVQVIWLTPPTMKKPKLNTQMAQLTKIMHEGIDDTQVVLLDAKPLLATSDAYQDSIVIDGKTVKVRTADGIHFTPDGQKYVAKFLLEHIHIKAQDE